MGLNKHNTQNTDPDENEMQNEIRKKKELSSPIRRKSSKIGQLITASNMGAKMTISKNLLKTDKVDPNTQDKIPLLSREKTMQSQNQSRMGMGGGGGHSKEVFNLFSDTKKDLEKMLQRSNDYVAETHRVNRGLINDDVQKQLKALEKTVSQ